jgi:hypothetical protein
VAAGGAIVLVTEHAAALRACGVSRRRFLRAAAGSFAAVVADVLPPA